MIAFGNLFCYPPVHGNWKIIQKVPCSSAIPSFCASHSKPQTLNPETTSKPSLRSDDRLHAMEFPLVVGEEVLRTFRVVGNLQVEADGLGFWAWVFGVV